jgi:hypothetical protein
MNYKVLLNSTTNNATATATTAAASIDIDSPLMPNSGQEFLKRNMTPTFSEMLPYTCTHRGHQVKINLREVGCEDVRF